jgi:hypothetical protein
MCLQIGRSVSQSRSGQEGPLAAQVAVLARRRYAENGLKKIKVLTHPVLTWTPVNSGC